jgi:hypothetical protein
MMKPTILTLATVLALSTAPAMAAGLITGNTASANALTLNGLNTANTVVANGLNSSNTVVANGLHSDNTKADNAVGHAEVHLVGATGAAVADGNVIVLRLVAVEYLPE